MVNYNNGKIYKIEAINGEEGDMYIGSTTRDLLSQRMSKHRSEYNLWINNKKKYYSSYIVFEKYGLENCRIVLIENVNVMSKDELLSREAFYIKSMSCVNKYIPMRKTKERYEKDKEKIRLQQKLRYNENKEQIKLKNKLYQKNNSEQHNLYREKYNKKETTKETQKLYYENNKEKINETQKLYRENNKEKIKLQKKLYCENNKEKIKEKSKLDYEKIKEKKKHNIINI
jgi:hypothetical protein